MQWERYSEQALKTILRAKELAVKLKAQQIAPEHLLISMLEEQGTIASQLLEGFGVDADQLIQNLSERQKTTTETVTEQPPMTPSLQRILKRAVSEARFIGEEHVDTSHLLLSLLRERSAEATKLLSRQGVRYEDVRRRLFRIKAEELGEAPSITLPEAFVVDISESVLSGEVQPVWFWRSEREAIKRTLLRREQRNPLLVGYYETTLLLVQQFAYDLLFGSLPEGLEGRHILTIDWAGIWLHRQDVESVLTELLTEIQRVEPTPLLFVGDLKELQTRSTPLLTAIQYGYVQVIASATPEFWSSFAQQFPSLANSFSPIQVTEPDESSSLDWLRAHRVVYEEFHRVSVDESALVASVQLAKLNFPDRPLLATAKNLLDEACSHARCQVLTPKELRLLEDEMEQLQAEMRRLLRTNEREHLSELMEKAIVLQSQIESLREQHRTVTPQVTAETVQFVAQK